MEKKKFSFNIIDLFIVLIIVGAVALLGYVFIFSDKTPEKKEMHDVECVVEITRINTIFRDKIGEGDPVINPNNNRTFGKLSGTPERRPSITTVFDENAKEEIYPEVPNADDYIVTFVGSAEKTEWGYKFADLYIIVNDAVSFQIGDMLVNGTCIKMTVLN